MTVPVPGVELVEKFTVTVVCSSASRTTLGDDVLQFEVTPIAEHVNDA